MYPSAVRDKALARAPPAQSNEAIYLTPNGSYSLLDCRVRLGPGDGTEK